jgi:hypothetical protein
MMEAVRTSGTSVYYIHRPDDGDCTHLWIVGLLRSSPWWWTQCVRLERRPTTFIALIMVTVRTLETSVCYIHRPDDGGSSHLWNVGLLQRVYTAQ